MQSSFNLIKNNKALVDGGKKIETRYEIKREEDDVEDPIAIEATREEQLRKSYEIIGSNIISRAQESSQRILAEVNLKAEVIEKEAYERGYSQGQENGYEDGYKNGYEAAINQGKSEIAQVISIANDILRNAELEYENYLEDKKEQIINLALEMAKVIARKEFEKNESIFELITPAMDSCKGEENIIIRCNGQYIEDIKNKVPMWKSLYSLKGEVFVLEDPLMDIGNGVIEKKTGKIVVGMDIALKKLEEAISSKK